MSDPLDRLLSPLREAPPPAPFAPAARVRRRGRQRSRRTAAAVVAALVVSVGAVTAVPQLGADSADPSEGVGASPTRSPVSLSAALLTAAEVGPGVRAEQVDDLGPDGPDWPWALTGCDAYRPADYSSLRQRGPAAILAYARAGQLVATQTVERYAVGAGQANVDDIRGVVTACSSYPVLGPPIYDEGTGLAHRLEVTAEGLAGDESLLVRETTTPVAGQPPAASGPPTAIHHVVVRRGDLVTTITVYGDERLARRLAPLAANRL